MVVVRHWKPIVVEAKAKLKADADEKRKLKDVAKSKIKEMDFILAKKNEVIKDSQESLPTLNLWWPSKLSRMKGW